MAHRGTAFSDAAFRYVDGVIGAIGVVARFANHNTPADVVAPRLVGYLRIVFGRMCRARRLRIACIARSSCCTRLAAKQLQSELDEVI
jgi:hypothetical protein